MKTKSRSARRQEPRSEAPRSPFGDTPADQLEQGRSAYAALLKGLTLPKRRELSTEAALLGTLLGVTNVTELLADRRGKHWAAKRVTPLYEVTVRGGDPVNMTIEEAVAFTKLKSSHQLRHLMTRGDGTAHLMVVVDGIDQLVDVKNLQPADPVLT